MSGQHGKVESINRWLAYRTPKGPAVGWVDEAGRRFMPMDAEDAGWQSMHGVELLAPAPRPGKVMGIALNYRDHATETGREVPQVQTWFSKAVTAVNGPYAPVVMPGVSQALDHEVELVVVIGKRARHVPEDRAREVIAGVCVGCDYSVRDWQRATPTMILGKSFDSHAVFGPWVTSLAAVGDLSTRRLRCLVNGEIRQDGVIGDMVFGIEAQIAHLSKAMTLEPGDVIFTGTPAGVGAAHNPPKFLKVGDIVRCEIDGLGHIENEIVAENVQTVIG